MKWGKEEKALQAMYVRTGKVPKAIQDKPHLNFYHRQLYQAFWRLRRRAGAGMAGPSPIPFKEMESFGSIYLFDDLRFFCRVMEDLDLTFSDNYADKQGQKTKAEKAGSRTK